MRRCILSVLACIFVCSAVAIPVMALDYETNECMSHPGGGSHAGSGAQTYVSEDHTALEPVDHYRLFKIKCIYCHEYVLRKLSSGCTRWTCYYLAKN